MNTPPEKQQSSPDRWTLVRDIAVLQAKLIVDGLRDLILVPASLVAGIVSLFSSEDGQQGSQFYRLLSVGKQSERWINLFGALENAPPGLDHIEPFPDADMDELVGRLESFVVSEHKRGGITAHAKERFDRAINAVKRGHDSDNEAG
jgi:hypothetical protein